MVKMCPTCGQPIPALTPEALARHLSTPRANGRGERQVYETASGGYWAFGLGRVQSDVVAEALRRGLIKPKWPDAPPDVRCYVAARN
jgi:hypothetical protein